MRHQEIVIKVKKYFQNSPLRIGITFFLVHVFFLSFALFSVLDGNFGDFVPLAGFMVYIFPMLAFGILEKVSPFIVEKLPLFVIPIFYYGLFFVLLKFSKNTESQQFKRAFWIFFVWFAIALTIGLVALIAGN